MFCVLCFVFCSVDDLRGDMVNWREDPGLIFGAGIRGKDPGVNKTDLECIEGRGLLLLRAE